KLSVKNLDPTGLRLKNRIRGPYDISKGLLGEVRSTLQLLRCSPGLKRRITSRLSGSLRMIPHRVAQLSRTCERPASIPAIGTAYTPGGLSATDIPAAARARQLPGPCPSGDSCSSGFGRRGLRPSARPAPAS